MKNVVSVNLALLVLALLCSCSGAQENTDTFLCFDTVVSLTADCDDETLGGAFLLCNEYDELFNKSKSGSDVYKLNNKSGRQTVDDDTLKLLEKAVYYGEISDGKFDVTLYDVISLWDFNEEVIPSKDEIAEALKNVDYESIKFDGNTVDLSGKRIDLGGIAKGYIADRLVEYFEDKGTEKGIINLGGNVVVFGDKENKIGIKNPFSDGEISATVTVKNKSVVTSGVYERSFKKDGKLYHHILDTATGYPVESDLMSATVISDNSVDGDALSTICVIFGKEKAVKLIESIENTECILIDKSGKIEYSSGLYCETEDFYLKNN